MNRIFVSVDVSNLYYTIKLRFGNRKIDYRKLQKYCRDRGWVYRSVAYASEMNGKAEDFFNCIKTIGYEVKSKCVRTYVDHGKVKQKANMDIEIAMDIVRFSSHFDELILVSSDGDMIPVVKYCQEQGIKVHILGCMINSGLRDIADSTLEIGPALLEKGDMEDDTQTVTSAKTA
jgi:uncharacterized LabA/DUF88 family protein